MNLEEVVTRVGRRDFHEVQPNCVPTARGDGAGVQETRGVSVFGIDALAGRAGADEGVHVGCEDWPPYRAASQRPCFVPPKMPAVKFREDQLPKRRVIWNAKAIPP